MDDVIEEDDAGAFPAPANAPGQAQSRRAYSKLLEEKRDECPWWSAYLDLRSEGWDWRKAAFIAWSALPAEKRWPKTQQELARDVLGLHSDRTLRKWQQKNPRVAERIETALLAPLRERLPNVIAAWVAVAEMRDPSAHKDRITLLQTMKVYKPPAKSVELTGKDGAAVAVDFDAEYRKDMADLMKRMNAEQAPAPEDDE
jgi:hypothetical protein